MYTGIVKGLFEVKSVQKSTDLIHYSVALTDELVKGLEIGASVSVDGVCQTVIKIEGDKVYFDAIQETLEKTTLDELFSGRMVTIERSLKMGDEIGGHMMAGHVYGTASIENIKTDGNRYSLNFRCPKDWMKYILSKGFIGLDGASLTVGNVEDSGIFVVHLIPETLRLTTFGFKKEGDRVNVELDPQTKAIVDTVERFTIQKLQSN